MEGGTLTAHKVALFAGYISTGCFFLQYLPQIYLNYKRKSIAGFSTTSIIIKLVGAGFLFVNSILLEEPLPVILYGFINVLQHSIFCLQFTLFTQNKVFLIWILFPIIPYLAGTLTPLSIPYTNSIKPFSQIASHIPQMVVTWHSKSTEGVSLLSHHFNLIGGLCGIYMYRIIPPKSFWNYLLFINSVFQAISIYAMAIYFDGLERVIKSFFEFGAPTKKERVIDVESPKDESSNNSITTTIANAVTTTTTTNTEEKRE